MSELNFLKACSNLKPGFTLCLSDMTVVDSLSWMSLMKRRMNRENRYSILEKVEYMFSKIVLDYHVGKTEIDCYTIVNAIEGAKTLLLTYKQDEDFCKKLQEILHKVEKMLKSSVSLTSTVFLSDGKTYEFFANNREEIERMNLLLKEESEELIEEKEPEPDENNSELTLERDRFNYYDPTDSMMIEKMTTSENNIIKKTHTWTNFVPNNKLYPQMFKTLSDNNIVSKYLSGSFDLD